MLFVLTAEPYHDNSCVLGVFDNKEDAARAFLAAFDPNCNFADEWRLSSWDNNGTERKTLHMHAKDIRGGKVEQATPIHWINEPKWHADYEEVDPLTFEW